MARFFMLGVAFALLFLVLLANPARADTDGTILPDIYQWSEQHRNQAVDGGLLVWAPDGSEAVEAQGLNLDYWSIASDTESPSAPARVVGADLADLNESLYPFPMVVDQAEFTPNGSWFVAVFAVPPSTPSSYGTPAFKSTTVHLAIWNTTGWKMMDDRVIATFGSLYECNSSLLPMRFSISPQGDRILSWISGYSSPSQTDVLE